MDKLVDGFVRDKLLDFHKASFKIPCKQLAEQINKSAKFKLDETDLHEYLRKRDLSPGSTQRFKFPLEWEEDYQHLAINGGETKMKIIYLSGAGRCYEFKIEDWLSTEEIQEFEGAPELDFKKAEIQDPAPTPEGVASQLSLPESEKEGAPF